MKNKENQSRRGGGVKYAGRIRNPGMPDDAHKGSKHQVGKTVEHQNNQAFLQGPEIQQRQTPSKFIHHPSAQEQGKASQKHINAKNRPPRNQIARVPMNKIVKYFHKKLLTL